MIDFIATIDHETDMKTMTNILMKRHPFTACALALMALLAAGCASERDDVSAMTGTTKSELKQTYHVSPWRSMWGWILFLPFSMACAIGALFADKPDERAGLWIGTLAFALVIAGLMTMIRRARLEIRRDGLTLRQIGFRLEAPWSDVIAFRANRGHEGFITSKPVGGRGANTLAAAAGLDSYGMYDGDQIDLLDEHRLIPIEAFAWHLRHGPMRAQIVEYAPHLANDLAHVDDKRVRTPFDRRAFLMTTAIIAASLSVTPLLLMLGDRAQMIVFDLAYAIVDPLLAVSSAMATWQMIQRRSWLFTGLMAMMTLIMIGWTLVHWGRLLA